MFDGKYGAAEPLFLEAVRLVPEPKYKPTDDLLAKTEKLIAKVHAECKAQRIACTGMK